MKKSFLSALMLILAIGANAQNPAEWQKGQEVTENLLWTDYRCDNNENGGWQTKGDNVDLWTSPCFELYANNGNNEAGAEVYQLFYLPAGAYEFHVNGFYRHMGSGLGTIEEAAAGNIVKGAVVFCETDLTETGEKSANSIEFTKQMADIISSLTDTRLWERTQEGWDDGDGEYIDAEGNYNYFPQCQNGCVPRFFDYDLCKNVLTVIQKEDGYVRLGVRKLVTNANNTICFANFRAFYLDEPSASVELILARDEYNEKSASADKFADKIAEEMGYGSLYAVYQDALMELDGEYGSSTSVEKYNEGTNKIGQLIENFENYMNDAKKLELLVKLTASVSQSTNYPGLAAFKQAITDAKNILADNEMKYVQFGDEYGKSCNTLQQARVDYAMSQEKLADGSWDFTSLVAYPFFVDIECNPTWSTEEGIWKFPETVTRDNVKINANEYWYDTDVSGWRHYALEEHANMYCADHWTQNWGATALTQEVSGLPDGYYSIAGMGMGGAGDLIEKMWIEISSGDQTIASAHGTWKAGFWEGGSVYDWTTFTTDIIKITDGKARLSFCDDGDNHLAFTGMQLFYYGPNPNFSLKLQPLVNAVREQAGLLSLQGDIAAVEAILAQIPAEITTEEEYFKVKELINEAQKYTNIASEYVASHDLTALFAELADKYAENEQVTAAIEVAQNKSFDIYDNPNATYKDIQAMYADYEAYVQYFEVVKNYQTTGASDNLNSKVNEQMTALGQKDGYSNAEQLANYERTLAAIFNKEIFEKLDIAHASEENPVDVTFLIKNASFDEGGKYWIGNADMDATVGASQVYNNSFEVKQTLYSVPAGTYMIRMQGLYRDGSIKDAIDHMWTGEGYTPNFKLYANNAEADVVSIANDKAMFTERSFTEYTFEGKDFETDEPITLKAWVEDTEEEIDGVITPVTKYWRQGFESDGLPTNLDDSENGWLYDEAFNVGIETIYYPNSTRGAANRFANDEGAYENMLKVSIEKDGDLTIGARKLTTIEGDWCAFDNFRLYYIGAYDPTVDINDVTETAQNKVAGIYGLDGIKRQALKQGVNIVISANGKAKKVYIK